MSQEPNNTEDQQPENIDGMTDAGAAEDGTAEAANCQSDDIQMLMEAAETEAAGPTSSASDGDATKDSAGKDEAAVATPAADKGPTGGTGDESGGASPVPAEEDEAAIQETLAAAEESAADGGGGAPAPADDLAAATQTVLESAEQEGAPRATTPQVPPDTVPFQPPDFGSDAGTAHTSQLDLLDDVELDVKIELGRTEMYIEDVLGLGAGSVVELDKGAGEPVDIFVNERLVARGEVLVLNDNFCVRINDILSPVPELEE